MTDDLVKRLRMADEYLPLGHDGWEAADRIDELEVSLQAVLNREAATTARYDAKTDELEAKLAECLERNALLEARLGKAVDAAVDAGASLAAAISLLERGGRKAAPSNKMFDQMLVDYRNSLERTRATLAEIEGSDAP
jgi:hypothetical protein